MKWSDCKIFYEYSTAFMKDVSEIDERAQDILLLKEKVLGMLIKSFSGKDSAQSTCFNCKEEVPQVRILKFVIPKTTKIDYILIYYHILGQFESHIATVFLIMPHPAPSISGSSFPPAALVNAAWTYLSFLFCFLGTSEDCLRDLSFLILHLQMIKY